METLAALGALGLEDSCISAFPALFYLLEDKQGTSPRSRLELLMTLSLSERPFILICLATPEPHIRVLWGVQCVTPFFTNSTPEDRKVPAFSQYARLGILPKFVEVKPEWLTVQEVTAPTIADLDTALVETGPRTPILPETTAASDTVVVPKTMIAPLELVHIVLGSGWNVLAPVTIKCLALLARQRLKPPLE